MKRASVLLFIALTATAVSAQETFKDRKAFIPNRKQVAIGGKAIGILLTDGQPVLSSEGRSGPGDQLVFSSGGNSYRWVYVPTQDRPLITNLQVPVGDKGEKTVYASLNLANPPSMLAWAIKTPYTLVEVEVNGGRGSPAGDSFVGTDFKALDGTADYPLKVVDVIKQVKDRHAEHVVKEKDTIEKAMKDHGDKVLAGKQPTGPRKKKDLMYLTWLPESSTITFISRRRSATARINSLGVGQTGRIRRHCRRARRLADCRRAVAAAEELRGQGRHDVWHRIWRGIPREQEGGSGRHGDVADRNVHAATERTAEHWPTSRAIAGAAGADRRTKIRPANAKPQAVIRFRRHWGVNERSLAASRSRGARIGAAPPQSSLRRPFVRRRLFLRRLL